MSRSDPSTTPAPGRAARALALLAAAVGAGACGAGRSSLAAPGASLRPCPGTPNCVSTEATDTLHSMPPVAFAESPALAQRRARAALDAEPRTRVVLERPGYLRAEARSRLLRFVDDVEIVIDSAAGVFRFRSASRLGRSDLGVNRARMQRVTALLAEMTPPPAAPTGDGADRPRPARWASARTAP
jgi:uncharacterized protein (DUF1499 family)